GMPSVDGRVVLHAGIAALPGGFGHFLHQFPGRIFFTRPAVIYVAGPPVAIFFDGAHEVVGYTDGVVRILKEHGCVGFAIDGGIVALLDQDLSFTLLFRLTLDKFDDVRVIDVEDHHLGGPSRLAAALDHACERVESFHKANGSGGDTAARK